MKQHLMYQADKNKSKQATATFEHGVSDRVLNAALTRSGVKRSLTSGVSRAWRWQREFS
ncbi:protein of unknown function [Georgfuchsia toluolica]|uniref:Uncharacterized protein n=1 Tax=Georgfuchsia toluolica TaxID=424218 RepID=A0A916J3R3_9PROT|nr:protein of unknown function [Georgfuchsia toluolica]